MGDRRVWLIPRARIVNVSLVVLMRGRLSQVNTDIARVSPITQPSWDAPQLLEILSSGAGRWVLPMSGEMEKTLDDCLCGTSAGQIGCLSTSRGNSD
jgi:hypothetical protein